MAFHGSEDMSSIYQQVPATVVFDQSGIGAQGAPQEYNGVDAVYPLGAVFLPEQQQRQYVLLSMGENMPSQQQVVYDVVGTTDPAHLNPVTRRHIRVEVAQRLGQSRTRRRFSEKQLKILLQHYARDKKPNEYAIMMIADEIGEKDHDRVATWFRNRRTRERVRPQKE